MTTLRAEEHQKRESTEEGWPIGITSFRLGERWICHVDNVSPGAVIARGNGTTREEAEAKALEVARSRLRSTRRMRDTLQDLRSSVDRLSASLPKK